jgi:tRNA (guanine9-N1)-methyltransferase
VYLILRQALCENKARSQSVRTARLPIGIYLKELPTRKVLTVNQVLDILLNWVEHRDWKKALFDVIPQRKFEVVSKKARRGKKRIQDDEEKESNGEDEEMDEETPAKDEISHDTHLPANVGDLSQVHT